MVSDMCIWVCAMHMHHHAPYSLTVAYVHGQHRFKKKHKKSFMNKKKGKESYKKMLSWMAKSTKCYTFFGMLLCVMEYDILDDQRKKRKYHWSFSDS